MSPTLVKQVQRAIQELHYQPDSRARDLRNADNTATSIGFVMVDVANPFFSSILRGLEEVARDRDCMVLSGSSDGDPVRQAQLIQTFIARRVSGLVVVPSGERLGPIAAEILRGTPVVFVDREPSEFDSDIVRSDHEVGTHDITRHLIEHGHREIAFLGEDPSVVSAVQRQLGFRRAMAQAGIEVRPEWVVAEHHSAPGWHTVARDWLSALNERPTAIVSAMNFVTIGAVRALHELGLQREIALIGFDDLELAELVEPGISVIPQQPRDLGRIAGELLFKRLDGSSHPTVREFLTSPIIARGSGEIPGPHVYEPAAV